MVDLGTVSVRGAFNYARARVLWQDNLLRVYGPSGIMIDIISEKPTRKRGHLRAWDIETAKGVITARMKCISCGGRAWWRIAFMSSEELWGSE